MVDLYHKLQLFLAILMFLKSINIKRDYFLAVKVHIYVTIICREMCLLSQMIFNSDTK